MKALKLSAVIFTALLALSACKTAPGGSSADAKLREGLNDALGQIGSVAGMDGYRNIKKAESPPAGTYQQTTELYFDAGFTKFSLVQAAVYDGRIEMGSEGATLVETFNNEIIQKEATKATLSVVAPADYDIANMKGPDGTAIDNAALGSYKFYKIDPLDVKEWASEKAGGDGTWKKGTFSNAGFQVTKSYYIKVEGATLHIIGITINSDKSVQFNDDPRSPSAENTYTKK